MSTDRPRPESSQAPVPPLTPAELTPPADAVHTITGLIYRVLRTGPGDDRPGPRDRAVVRMTRWGADGRPIEALDSVTLLLDRIAPALAEAAQIMIVGEMLRLWIQEPSGRQIVDIELLAFERTEPPRMVPPELRSPRSD